MKKIYCAFIAFFLIFSVTSANYLIDSNILKNLEQLPNEECWDLAVETYNIFDDSGHDREKCIEMGVWAYESCLDDLEEGLQDSLNDI